MMYYEFTAGNKTYKLRLNTRNIVALEQKLGCNPVMVFKSLDGETLPTVSVMVTILHASLQALNHGISFEVERNLKIEDQETTYYIVNDTEYTLSSFVVLGRESGGELIGSDLTDNLTYEFRDFFEVSEK